MIGFLFENDCTKRFHAGLYRDLLTDTNKQTKYNTSKNTVSVSIKCSNGTTEDVIVGIVIPALIAHYYDL